MDPPAVRRQAQTQQRATGFPSPTQDYKRINPKFTDDCTRMTFAIQQSLPEAVRRIVRDHWEKCLLGSEFHQAFILNASIHHALPSITQRAVRDFGGKMVAESRDEIIGHFTAADLDQVADLIISKASDSFLDKCLEKRLLTIEAKPLVNALAKAERLGYDPNDVVQEDQHERAIPQEAYPGAAAAANGFQSGPSPPSAGYPPQHPLQCMKCFRTFVHSSAYDHHMRYNVCSQIPPTTNGFEHSCQHCGQGFTRLEELLAHIDHKICGNFGQTVKSARGPGRPPRTTPVAQPSPVPILPSMAPQSPTTNGHPSAQPTQPQSTPVHASVASRAAAATPGSTGSPNISDPYAHLSEKQMQSMNEELQAAELKYAPRFAEAEQIADETARRARIEGLRNSFGTKQSMIRKKYGVRLRERRTKAEIQAERERMGIKRAEKERARASIGAQQRIESPATTADPNPRPVGGSGWTAANTPRASSSAWEEHDAKRRRIDDSGGYQTPYKSMADETPMRKTLSVSEMGGGPSGSSATAVTHDTALPPPSQPSRVYEQSSAWVEVHDPPKTDQPGRAPTVKPESRSQSATPTGSDAGAANGRSLDERHAGEKRGRVTIDDDSSSSGDDEDIPSALPTHVRKSLGTSLLQQTP
ncbi:hypothetical protein MMYC01_200169 [Madurella mycetomatis]|uniref:C2H2-type domain-containing protein n=1 Tax=Madurella mycetomatis TaxID=100816 RepID=A0A150ATN7_9PEZI|nr:hypothetical protein MMYC01_200169 [Madurella mycetomatis]